jgi:hypothetical protein
VSEYGSGTPAPVSVLPGGPTDGSPASVPTLLGHLVGAGPSLFPVETPVRLAAEDRSSLATLLTSLLEK